MATRKGIDVSTTEINKVVVHILPKHKKDNLEVLPTYSEELCILNDGLTLFFKDKIVSSLISNKAIRLKYDAASLSPISSYSKKLIVDKEDLISYSQKIAKHLFEVQGGTNNQGVLVVLDCQVNKKSALIFIKLEMDTGIQLVLDKVRKTYDLKEVLDLMLTKKTKIYKIVLLVEKSLHKVLFDGIIADYQIDTKAKTEIKSWFINKFLGCVPHEEPQIFTQNFYNYTKAYIDTLDDDVKRAKYHQDLNSYILKNSAIISGKEFANDYLSSTEERDNYKQFLATKNFSFDSFMKDTTQIERRLQKITLEFANDLVLIGNGGSFDGKVKFESLESGQTKAEIISRIRTIK